MTDLPPRKAALWLLLACSACSGGPPEANATPEVLDCDGASTTTVFGWELLVNIIYEGTGAFMVMDRSSAYFHVRGDCTYEVFDGTGRTSPVFAWSDTYAGSLSPDQLNELAVALRTDEWEESYFPDDPGFDHGEHHFLLGDEVFQCMGCLEGPSQPTVNAAQAALTKLIEDGFVLQPSGYVTALVNAGAFMEPDSWTAAWPLSAPIDSQVQTPGVLDNIQAVEVPAADVEAVEAVRAGFQSRILDDFDNTQDAVGMEYQGEILEFYVRPEYP